ncbi:MAG: SgcJ/EcaC family oxidoreductase, partial [Longimicrobiales bacterium]
DLEGFLDDYTDDPGLAFVGASGVRRGKDAVRASYRESYFDVEGEPDDLAFDQLEIRPLGSGFALAHGRWTLFEPGFETQTVSGQGRFSLVLRKEGERWRIIHDHSS